MQRYRQIAGAIAMAIGGLALLGGAGLMALMTANFVEWPNAADALSTIAMVTGPIIAGGFVILLLGRWLFGAWRAAKPLQRALPWLIGISGAAAALVYGVLLINVLVRGFGPEDYAAAIKLGVATLLGLGAALWARRARSAQPNPVSDRPA